MAARLTLPLARAAALGLFLLALALSAWMSDDAYITLRTVNNWINGFGLRWNALAGASVAALTWRRRENLPLLAGCAL